MFKNCNQISQKIPALKEEFKSMDHFFFFFLYNFHLFITVIHLHLNTKIKLLKTLKDGIVSKLTVRRNDSRPIQEIILICIEYLRFQI